MLAWKRWSCVALCALFTTGCSDSSEGPGKAGAASSYQGMDDEAGSALAVTMRGAEQVVVATVEDVTAKFAQNEYGDKLILSTVTLSVREGLRGNAPAMVRFELEGGTVGDLTLAVSDMPKLTVGDRGVFALRRSRTADEWVPNGRALGILLVDIDGDLGLVRRAERASR